MPGLKSFSIKKRNKKALAFKMRETDQLVEDEKPWTFRSIRWKQVFRRQDHANLILTLGFIIAVLLVTFLSSPRQDIYYIYDGEI